jgi:hypothetical protein
MPAPGLAQTGPNLPDAGATAELNYTALPSIAERAGFGAAVPDAHRAAGGSESTAAGQLSQFRCACCGYGASCKIAPERCPMCGGGTWEYEEPQWHANAASLS